jgi:type IV pilus assembly protein PilZ
MSAPEETKHGLNSGKGILSITIKEVSVLHASYMPFIVNGGLFIPTEKSYEIGDEVFILLNLLEEEEQLPLAGTVIWITPLKSQNKRAPGIGVQFNDKETEIKGKIENYLTGLLGSEKLTHTM